MEFMWLRPAINPVPPSEIGELSTSAVRVLQALRRRFQLQRHLPASVQSEPLRFLGISHIQNQTISECQEPFNEPLRHHLLDLPKSNTIKNSVLTSACLDALTVNAPLDTASCSEVIFGQQSDAGHAIPFSSCHATYSPLHKSISSEEGTEGARYFQEENEAWESGQVPPYQESFHHLARVCSAVSSLSSSPVSTILPAEDDVLENELRLETTGQSFSLDNLSFTDEDSRFLGEENKASNASECHRTRASVSKNYDDNSANNDDEILNYMSLSFTENTLTGNDFERESLPHKVTKRSGPSLHQDASISSQDKQSPKSCQHSFLEEVCDAKLIAHEVHVLPPTYFPSKEGIGALDTLLSDYSLEDNSSGVLEFEELAQDENSKMSPNVSKIKKKIEVNTPDNKGKKRKYLGNPFKRALSASCISTKELEHSPAGSYTTQLSEKRSEIRTPLKSRDNNVVEISSRARIESSPLSNILHSETEPVSSDRTAELHEKITDEVTPSTFIPTFQSNGQARCKDDSTVESRTDSTHHCRKKMKFMVPYKKKEGIKGPSGHKTIQELASKLNKDSSQKKAFQKLSLKLADELKEKMLQSSPQETCMTIQFKGGCCQLNRPQKSETCQPETILLRLAWPSSVQYVSVSLETPSWSSSFLETLLSDKSRKICFEAQEIVQLFLDKFNFPPKQVSTEWLILDPLIGCWLLNPDEPPHSFHGVLKLLKLPEVRGGIEELLDKLSLCAQVLYETLTSVGLWKLYLHIEMRITPILACMEHQGIQVDVKKLQEMGRVLKHRLETVQRAAYEAAGRPFQLTSPQQLSAILYDYLKLDSKHKINVKETDKRHSKSTSEAMLVKFKDIHPLPGIVLEYRGLHKLKSTYVDALLAQVSENHIYTTWDQIAAATGRITSNEPNLQTIPKQPLIPDLPLRAAFVSHQGYSFLAADFQHIELRVFAHLSRDDALIDALNQATDVFKVLCQQWMSIADLTEVSQEDRDKTKRIVYALMYGAGPSKLVEILQIDYNQAARILKKFSSSFPKMQEFTRNTIAKCSSQGYLATETGRRRLFPHIGSSNSKLRMYSERQAVNFLVQGTAADLCKCAMVHTQRHIAAVGTCSTPHLLLQIHDELLWEVPDPDLLEVTNVVQDAMEGAISVFQSLSNFSLPLPVVMKTGKTWEDMKVVKNVTLGSTS